MRWPLRHSLPHRTDFSQSFEQMSRLMGSQPVLGQQSQQHTSAGLRYRKYAPLDTVRGERGKPNRQHLELVLPNFPYPVRWNFEWKHRHGLPRNIQRFLQWRSTGRNGLYSDNISTRQRTFRSLR